MTLTPLKKILNRDANRCVTFNRTSDTGKIRYDIDKLYVPDEADYSTETVWINVSISGLYDTLDDAVTDAFRAIDWLNEEI